MNRHEDGASVNDKTLKINQEDNGSTLIVLCLVRFCHDLGLCHPSSLIVSFLYSDVIMLCYMTPCHTTQYMYIITAFTTLSVVVSDRPRVHNSGLGMAVKAATDGAH